MAVPHEALDQRTVAATGADPDAAIFAAVYPSLRRFAAVVGSSADDPDDLVQEALANTLAVRSLAELDHPTAYLRRAISNLVVNRVRADATHRPKRALLAADGEARDTYPSDLGVLDALGPEERAVLFLADVEGRPFPEVAAMIGLTPVAARLRASRARRRLRTLLEEER